MVSPINHNLNTAASNQILSLQISSTEAERSDRASSSKISEKLPPEESINLPCPPKEPINMALVEKHLKEWYLDFTLKLERDPYGHETSDSNPPTPISTPSEGSEFPLGASFDVFKG